MMGTIRLSDSEADHIIIIITITSGLAVFMRAYALSPPEALLLVAPPLTVSLAPRRSAPNSLRSLPPLKPSRRSLVGSQAQRCDVVSATSERRRAPRY